MLAHGAPVCTCVSSRRVQLQTFLGLSTRTAISTACDSSASEHATISWHPRVCLRIAPALLGLFTAAHVYHHLECLRALAHNNAAIGTCKRMALDACEHWPCLAASCTWLLTPASTSLAASGTWRHTSPFGCMVAQGRAPYRGGHGIMCSPCRAPSVAQDDAQQQERHESQEQAQAWRAWQDCAPQQERAREKCCVTGTTFVAQA